MRYISFYYTLSDYPKIVVAVLSATAAAAAPETMYVALCILGMCVRFLKERYISTDGQTNWEGRPAHSTLCRDKSKYLSGKLCTKRKISGRNV